MNKSSLIEKRKKALFATILFGGMLVYHSLGQIERAFIFVAHCW